MILLNKIKKQL